VLGCGRVSQQRTTMVISLLRSPLTKRRKRQRLVGAAVKSGQSDNCARPLNPPPTAMHHGLTWVSNLTIIPFPQSSDDITNGLVQIALPSCVSWWEGTNRFARNACNSFRHMLPPRNVQDDSINTRCAYHCCLIRLEMQHPTASEAKTNLLSTH
jgi:hypothetical protein